MQQDIVPPDLRRIMVISLGTLGDVVLSIAAIEAIRNYHDSAHIVLITEPYCARLFENCPYVDEVVTNHRSSGFKEDFTLSTALQAARFDMVYDLSCNDETNEIFKKFWVSKPKWSGIAMGCSHPHIDRGREKMHILDRHAEQLWLCGIGPKDGYPVGASPLPRLDYIFSKEEEINYHPKSLGIDYEFAILAPEAPFNEPKSAWPAFRFVNLGQILEENGLKPIIAGTNDAIALGNEIRAGVKSALDLVGRLDLLSFISLAKHARLVVGSNSDMSIIAGVVGAPLVALINPQSSHLKQVAPRGDNCVTLVAKDFAQIAPAQVLQAARAVIR